MASSPAVPRAGQVLLTPGQPGSRASPLLPTCPLSSPLSLPPPRTPYSPPLVAALFEILIHALHVALFLQALVLGLLDTVVFQNLLRHPLHHGELPVVPWSGMSPYFPSTPRITQAALFICCALDPAKGMASQLGVILSPRGHYVSWLGKKGGLVQFGYGQRPRMLRSTAHRTPQSVHCARGKKHCRQGI